MVEYKISSLKDENLEEALKNVPVEERGLLTFFIKHDLPIQDFGSKEDVKKNINQYWTKFMIKYEIVPSVELTVEDDKIGYYKDGSFNALAYIKEVINEEK